MLQAGTQISVSHHLARGMIFLISSANFLVSVAVMFIFQLPAITVLRYLRFMLFMSPFTVYEKIICGTSCLVGQVMYKPINL